MFQVSNFRIRHLYVALSVYHPKSRLLPSPYIRHILPSFTSSHPPFFLVIAILFLVSVSFYLFVCLFLHCCWFYIPPVSEIIQFSTFSIWLISLDMIFSWSIHVVTNGSVSSFFITDYSLTFPVKMNSW